MTALPFTAVRASSPKAFGVRVSSCRLPFRTPHGSTELAEVSALRTCSSGTKLHKAAQSPCGNTSVLVRSAEHCSATRSTIPQSWKASLRRCPNIARPRNGLRQ
jgi:hypothetical protein